MRFLVALALLLTAPRVAEPCSCSPTAPAISPADGSAKVPLNAIVIVQSRYEDPRSFSVEMRNAATSEVVTLGLDIRHPDWGGATTFFGRPVAPLEPNTTYVITVGPEMATSTFTTGDTTDPYSPTFDGLTSLTLETAPSGSVTGAPCASSCSTVRDDRLSRILIDYPPLPADVVYAALFLRRADLGPVAADELPLRGNTHVIGFDFCALQSPPLEPGVEYCASLVVYDIAGNATGFSSELCSIVVTCASGICDDANACVAEDPESEAGCGCTSAPSPGWLLLAVLGLITSRRRASRT